MAQFSQPFTFFFFFASVILPETDRMISLLRGRASSRTDVFWGHLIYPCPPFPFSAHASSSKDNLFHSPTAPPQRAEPPCPTRPRVCPCLCTRWGNSRRYRAVGKHSPSSPSLGMCDVERSTPLWLMIAADNGKQLLRRT